MLDSSIVAATVFGLMLLGGGLYEYLVVDHSWPKRPDLIQPSRGGITRGRFWILAHSLLELSLIIAIVAAWKDPAPRFWLLLALASHLTTRTWSMLYFIPRALAFEKAATVDEGTARRWTQLSLFRFPIEVLTCFFLFRALWVVWR